MLKEDFEEEGETLDPFGFTKSPNKHSDAESIGMGEYVFFAFCVPFF